MNMVGMLSNTQIHVDKGKQMVDHKEEWVCEGERLTPAQSGKKTGALNFRELRTGDL